MHHGKSEDGDNSVNYGDDKQIPVVRGPFFHSVKKNQTAILRYGHEGVKYSLG